MYKNKINQAIYKQILYIIIQLIINLCKLLFYDYVINKLVNKYNIVCMWI